jgi:DNA-binding transcriptional ArsR family regulator
MPPPGEGESVDYDLLESYLRALAHGRRLELLHILQSPHALADIHITPGKSRAGERPDRVSSRQAIQKHLETLQEIGVVVAATPVDGRGKEFVVDRQRVFQVLEELRRVGTITAGAFVSRDATVDASAAARERKLEAGPKLVLVHGFVEGKVFPLRRADVKDGAGWLIGRKADAHVCLDYDPFVSLVNSEVVLEDGQYRLRDLGISRNGTWLNWRRVGAEPAVLRPGDVVGVGRSLLAFQPD